MKISANIQSANRLAGQIANNSSRVKQFIQGEFGQLPNNAELVSKIRSAEAISLDKQGMLEMIGTVLNAPMEAARYDADGKERSFEEQKQVLVDFAVNEKVKRIAKLATKRESELIEAKLPEYRSFVESHLNAMLSARGYVNQQLEKAAKPAKAAKVTNPETEKVEA